MEENNGKHLRRITNYVNEIIQGAVSLIVFFTFIHYDDIFALIRNIQKLLIFKIDKWTGRKSLRVNIQIEYLIKFYKNKITRRWDSSKCAETWQYYVNKNYIEWKISHIWLHRTTICSISLLSQMILVYSQQIINWMTIYQSNSKRRKTSCVLCAWWLGQYISARSKVGDCL